jgi:outer membrane protein assembly factor BamB
MDRLVDAIRYDHAYRPVIASGRCLLATVTDERVVCLDPSDGAGRLPVLWSAEAHGAVRVPPTVVGDRVYFACDGGWAYCVRLADGGTIWTRRLAPPGRLALVNGRLAWTCTPERASTTRDSARAGRTKVVPYPPRRSGSCGIATPRPTPTTCPVANATT